MTSAGSCIAGRAPRLQFVRFMNILQAYFRFTGQKALGRAVIRNHWAQSLQIQCSTLTPVGRIFQKGLMVLLVFVLLVSTPEVYAAVGSVPPTASPSCGRCCATGAAHSINGALIAGASGYRANGSGGLTNMGGNGNYWSYASNSQANARNLNFNSGGLYPLNNNNRSNGFSVRPSRAFERWPDVCFSSMKYSFKQIHEMVVFAYLKAREEERGTLAQLEFELDLERNIKILALELYHRQWRPQPLDWFVHLDPTVREVFAPKFRDRIVSHVLFMMLSPIFERYFIFDSHSCRVGKGTLEGIERLEHNIRSVTDNYRYEAFSLNFDIQGYFMAIVRMRLYDIIWKTLGDHKVRYPDAIDYDFADYLITTFLSRDPLEGCVYHGDPALIKLVQPGKSLRDQEPGVGVPIGDVINQLNSNIYLNPFDQFVKRGLHIHHYNRYVDDGKQLHRSYDYLVECMERSGEFLDRELCLKLHPKKTTITSLYDTTYFLGAALLPYRRYAKNDSIGRFRAYIESVELMLEQGKAINRQDVLSSLNSRLGYLSHFDEIKMIQKTLSKAPLIMDEFAFTRNYRKAIIKPAVI